MTLFRSLAPAAQALAASLLVAVALFGATPPARSQDQAAQDQSSQGGDQATSDETLAEQAATAPDSEADEETLARLVDYLNGISTLKAHFVQVSDNGAFAEGDLYLERPGRLRFEYDPPHPALLIANGVTLLYYDRELEQATFLPLWETPLWFLLREKVDLEDGVEVLGVERGPGTVRVALRMSEDGADGQVTLVFSDQPVALHSWEIEDAQGILTRVALLNPQYGGSFDESLFEHGDLEIHFQNRENR